MATAHQLNMATVTKGHCGIIRKLNAFSVSRRFSQGPLESNWLVIQVRVDSRHIFPSRHSLSQVTSVMVIFTPKGTGSTIIEGTVQLRLTSGHVHGYLDWDN